MIQDANLKKCRNEKCEKSFRPFKTTDKYCCYECFSSSGDNKPKKKQRKRIKKVSQSRGIDLKRYCKSRKEYLSKPENQTCKIQSDKCSHKATTVEHRKGRRGYADQYAKDKDIPLLLDQRFWFPSCLQCNLELENNPELSKAIQLSKIHGGKKI